MLKFRRLPAMAFICLVICGMSWLSPGSQAPAEEKGTIGFGTIFVKGHYAYIADRSDTVSDEVWLHVYDIEDPNSISCCTSFSLGISNHHNTDVFVAGDYLYLVAYGGSTGLWKYDISSGNECSPRLVDNTWSYICDGVITDMYVNNEKAYVSMDDHHVVIFNVPDSTVSCDTVTYCENWYPSCNFCSPQGIHVRGGSAYIAVEDTDLWIRYIGDEEDVYADISRYMSEDVYNIGYKDSNLSMTYQIGGYHLRVWGDTTDVFGNHYIFDIGLCVVKESTHIVVHVTGDFIYAVQGKGTAKNWYVGVYEVGYGDPQVADTLCPDSGLVDFHVIHECDTTGSAAAHVFCLSHNGSLTPPWEIWIADDLDYSVSAYKYGDVDEDGDADLLDALKINYYTVRGYNSVIDNLDAADVDCDGEVNSYDSVYLLAYLFTGGPAPGAGCSFYEDW